MSERGRSRGFSIGNRITAAFAVMLLASVAMGGFVIQCMRVMNADAANVGQNYLPSAILNGDMATLVEKFHLQEARYVMAGGFGEMTDIASEFPKLAADYDRSRKAAEPLIDDGEERALYTRIDADMTRYRLLHDQLLPLMQKDDNEAAVTMFKSEINRVAEDLSALFEQDNAYNTRMGAMAAHRIPVAFHAALGPVSV